MVEKSGICQNGNLHICNSCHEVLEDAYQEIWHGRDIDVHDINSRSGMKMSTRTPQRLDPMWRDSMQVPHFDYCQRDCLNVRKENLTLSCQERSVEWPCRR